MSLPDEVLRRINLKVSRHKHPEKLNWLKRNGRWEAFDEGRTYVLIHDSTFGTVVAERKTLGSEADCEVA